MPLGSPRLPPWQPRTLKSCQRAAPWTPKGLKGTQKSTQEKKTKCKDTQRRTTSQKPVYICICICTCIYIHHTHTCTNYTQTPDPPYSGQIILIISAVLFQSERARLHCHSPIPSNSADPNQPLLTYLAISHPANCNLPMLYKAPCLIASS